MLLVRDQIALERLIPPNPPPRDLNAWANGALGHLSPALMVLPTIAHDVLLDSYLSELSADPYHHRTFGDFAGFFAAYVQRSAEAGALFPPDTQSESRFPSFCGVLSLSLSDPDFPSIPASEARATLRRAGAQRAQSHRRSRLSQSASQSI